MSDETKHATLKITVYWKSFQPDTRQYKPSNPYIETNLPIAIEVPLTTEFITNATQISIAQLSNQTEESPVLTPMGMRFIIDQLESVMSNPEKESFAENDEDEEWENLGKDEVEAAKPEVTEDEGWGETDEPSVEKSDEKWDEDWS